MVCLILDYLDKTDNRILLDCLKDFEDSKISETSGHNLLSKHTFCI